MVLLLAVPGVAAQNETAPLTVTPASLTITGDTSGIATRTLVLQASQDITGLSFKPLDLQDPDTGQTYPATMVSVNGTGHSEQVPEAQENVTSQDVENIAAGTSQDVTLQFELQGAKPGRFSGEYLFTYQDGGKTSLPVTMTLKDLAWGPAMGLSLAVIASYLLFQYGLLFKRKDEILRDLMVIQDNIKKDTDLAEKDEKGNLKYPFPHPFRTILLDFIRDAIENLSMDSIDNAVKSEGKVVYYWNKWKLDRTSWVAVLDYAKEVYEIVEPKLSEAQEKVKTNSTEENKAEEEKARDNLTKLIILIKSIPDITPEAAENELAKYDPRVKTRAPPDEGSEPQYEPRSKPLEMGAKAKLRLLAYQFGSMAVTVVILIFLGFTELYINNPTFGASLSDYLTLILWGLFVGPVSGAIAGKASSKITGVTP